MKMNENECFVKSMVGVIQKLETKVGAKLFRGHTRALDKWRNLAGEEAMNGVIVANIERPLDVRDCPATSWKYPTGESH